MKDIKGTDNKYGFTRNFYNNINNKHHCNYHYQHHYGYNNYLSKQEFMEKGITITALVVTIIVLLILAGITIQMTLDDNGIIKQAQRAKNTYEASKNEEQTALGMADDAINEALNSTSSSGGGSSSGSGSSSSGDSPSSGSDDDLQNEVNKLKDENDNLKKENDDLKDKNKDLEDENNDLKLKQATGNATPEQVLSGATFSTSAKIGQTGTMPVNAASDNVKNDKAWLYNSRVYFGIPYGYYPSGTYGELENTSERYITFGSLANTIGLTNAKLAVGQNVLGVNGTFTSDGTASADNISNGKVAYVNGKRIVGNGANESNSYNSGFSNGYNSSSMKNLTLASAVTGGSQWQATGANNKQPITATYTPNVNCNYVIYAVIIQGDSRSDRAKVNGILSAGSSAVIELPNSGGYDYNSERTWIATGHASAGQTISATFTADTVGYFCYATRLNIYIST